MERETGFEPATNGLEGRDSTPELLPPSPSPGHAKSGNPAIPAPNAAPAGGASDAHHSARARGPSPVAIAAAVSAAAARPCRRRLGGELDVELDVPGVGLAIAG